MKIFNFYPVILSLLISGCQTVKTTTEGKVGIDRTQRMMVSAEAIEESASIQYSKLMLKLKKLGKLNVDKIQTQRVKNITKRLIKQTTIFREDAPGWDWEINVLKSPRINAWCMPGGKIAVYSGLINKIKATDDELAAVIGHEIAHALREHSRERASERVLADIGISVLTSVAKIGRLGRTSMVYAYQGLVGLPNSRKHEIEADRIGIELSARAGFDPRAAISFWKKIGKLGKEEPPKFLSTHPSRDDRVNDLTFYSDKVMDLYFKSKEGWVKFKNPN
tara:strand:- start:402 stop:1235 length:834 start_codon:yes stop_codon:yes gene_type:complete